MLDKVQGWVLTADALHLLNLPKAANPAVDPKALFPAKGGTGGPRPGPARGPDPSGRKEGREREREGDGVCPSS